MEISIPRGGHAISVAWYDFLVGHCAASARLARMEVTEEQDVEGHDGAVKVVFVVL